MANPKHVEIVKNGAYSLNEWRVENPEEVLDLTGADLFQQDLSKFRLSGACLTNANLKQAKLNDTNLTAACLDGADLTEAQMSDANLKDASLQGSCLFRAILVRACLQNVNFAKADLRECKITRAILIGANLSNAKLDKSNLAYSDLSKSILKDSNLIDADLQESNLHSADLSKANLKRALLLKSNVDSTIFKGAKGLYGRNKANVSDVKGAEYAIFTTGIDRFLPWSRIKSVGDIPLFGISYLALIGIWLWSVSVHKINEFIRYIKSTEFQWATNLPELSVPQHIFWTLIAFILLAIASTIYKFSCPRQIKEYSELKWTLELNESLFEYRKLDYRRNKLRWVSAICYLISCPCIFILLSLRIYKTLIYLLFG